MKKLCLLLFLLFCSFLGFSQSDCITALTAEPGINSIEVTQYGYHWFSYELQAGKKLIYNSESSVDFYTGNSCYSLFYLGDETSESIFPENGNGGIIYFKVYPSNSETFVFTLNEVEFDPGDTCGSAVSAITGINSFDALNNIDFWYKFTLATNKKLILRTTELSTILFYKGSDCDSLISVQTGFHPEVDIFRDFVDGGDLFFRIIPYQTGTFEFSLVESDLEKGDNCGTAAVAASGINSFSGNASTKYWYSYDLPAGKKLNCSTSNPGIVEFFTGSDCDDLTFQGSSFGNQVINSYGSGGTVFFDIIPQNTETFEFTLTESDLEVGENCEFAESAVEGVNSAPSKSSRYYWCTYTMAESGNLNVDFIGNHYFSAYKGNTCAEKLYVGSSSSGVLNNLNAGDILYFQWDYNTAFDFTLTEEIAGSGEACSLAETALVGTNSVPSTNVTNYWYTFNVPNEGDQKLMIDPGDSRCISVYSGDCALLSHLNTSYGNVFVPLLSGIDEVYIEIETNGGVGNFDWTLSVDNLSVGEACQKPEQANMGINFTPVSPYWFEFTAPTNGIYTFSSVDLATTDTYLTVYSDCQRSLIARNDNWNGLQSQVQLELTENQTIYLLWDDIYRSEGFEWSISSVVFAPQDQSINFDAIADKLATDADFSIPASSTSGLALAYEVIGPASESGGILSLTGETGTVTVTASQQGNTNYNAALPVTQAFLVTDPNKTNQTIPFDALTAKTFGAAAFDLAATASSGLAVNYSSSNTSVATISGATITIVGAGTTEITAAQSGNEEFNAATSVLQTLTVNKADQIISVDDIADKEAEAAPFDVAASTSSDLALTYEVTGPATISGKTITLEGTAGTVNVTVSQVGNANYNAASEEVSFTVKEPKSDQTITISAIADKISDDAPFEVEASTTSGLALTYAVSGPATIAGTTLTLEATAGVVELTVSQAGNEEFNPATASVTFTVIEDSGLAGDINNDGVIGEGEIAGDIDEDGVIGEGEIAGDTNGNGVIDLAENGRNDGGEIAGDINGDGEIGEGEIAGDISGDGIIGEGEAIGDVNGDGSITEGEVEGDADGNGELDDEESAVLSTTSILNFKVFPNPVVDHLRIQGINLNVEEVVITDLKGSVFIKQQNVNTSEGLDIRQLPTGVYLLHISNANINYHLKFMKN